MKIKCFMPSVEKVQTKLVDEMADLCQTKEKDFITIKDKENKL